MEDIFIGEFLTRGIPWREENFQEDCFRENLTKRGGHFLHEKGKRLEIQLKKRKLQLKLRRNIEKPKYSVYEGSTPFSILALFSN